MKRPPALALLGGGLVALLAAGWLTAEEIYLGPAEERRGRIETLRARITQYEDAILALPNPADIKSEIGRSTLGRSADETAHWLRTLASELGKRNGLASVVVSHGRPRAEANPATDRGSELPSSFRDSLEESPAFATISGRVQGRGDLESALRAVADLQSQPWVHRFLGFQLEPANDAATSFELKADIETAFASDLRSADAIDPELAPPEPQAVARASDVAAPNPFAMPPPPPEPKPEPAPESKPAPKPQPSPPPPPYDKWRVVGVVETPAGDAPPEVMLVRVDQAESRTLTPGQRVLGAVIEGVDEGGVHVRIDDAWFRVEIGATLAERKKIDPPRGQNALD